MKTFLKLCVLAYALWLFIPPLLDAGMWTAAIVLGLILVTLVPIPDS